MQNNYDSRPDTWEHIHNVRKFLYLCIEDLLRRAQEHDQTKLYSPEVELFDVYTPRLKDLTYGSPEYQECLDGLKPALDHHYAKNTHHPEHWPAGIREMSLLDLLEMLVDWKAATMRHENGDLRQSIEINQKRFGYSDEMKSVLVCTAERLGLMPRVEDDGQ